MFETMHFEVHAAREQDLLHTAETHRAFKLLKAGRKRGRTKSNLFGGFGLVVDMLKVLRDTVYAILPHHLLRIGK